MDVVFVATPTGSCFGCQKLIDVPIRTKFDIQTTSNRVGFNKHVG